MNLPISAEEREGAAQKPASSGCGPETSAAFTAVSAQAARRSCSQDRIRYEPVRDRGMKSTRHHPATRPPGRGWLRIVIPCSSLYSPAATSPDYNRERKGTSAYLSPRGGWPHFLSRPLGLFPASCVALRICVEGGRSSWRARKAWQLFYSSQTLWAAPAVVRAKEFCLPRKAFTWTQLLFCPLGCSSFLWR